MKLELDRRNMLAVTGSSLALIGCSKQDTESKTLHTKNTAPDLTEQIKLLKSGEVKATELLETTIARIKTLNPKTGAVLTTCYDRARDFVKTLPANTVAGGAPMLIKDLKDVAGVRSTYGIGAFKNFTAPKSDIYVKRVETAGMAIVGKTNTPELGLLPVTEPLAYKPAKNPWDLTRTTGGSSGGTAAAVASGMMPCAQGSDGGGSIRIPAHYCGLFGLKPSRNRVVAQQKRGFSISVAGALSRTVRDSALMMSITETEDKDRDFPAIGLVTDPIDRPLKIGLALDDYFTGKNICGADVTAAIEKSARLCESLGHNIEVAKPPVFGSEITDAFLMLWASIPYETIALVEKMKGGAKVTNAEVEPWTQGLAKMFIDNGGYSELKNAIAKLKNAEQKTVAYLNKYDVVLSPVMPTPAHKLGKYDTGDLSKMTEGFDIAAASVGYTAVQNVSGAACMSVPLFRSPANLPIGSQFISAPGNDGLLLQLAYQLEAAQPWIDSYPDLL